MAVLLLCILSAGQTPADQHPPIELKIKGAYLLNFTRLVTWPNSSYRSANDPTVIGILGDTRLVEILEDALATRQPPSRRVVVLTIESLEQIPQCHLLFVSRKAETPLGEILEQASGFPILTVSDIEKFTTRGGAIWLFLDNDRIGMDINRVSEHHAQLQISSRLLRLARNVLEK
ncbi:MAG: YfiR family protein [bacterium]